MSAHDPAKKTVVIIGAGYAGMSAAKTLKGKFNIIIIDKKRYFEHSMALYVTVGQPRELARCRFDIARYAPYAKLIVGDIESMDDRRVLMKDGSSVAFDYSV